MHPAVGLVVAYLLGGIPTAYIAGRLTRGIDLREHGSGNLGATNVLRVLGGKVAAAVLAADIAKGALPTLLLPGLLLPGAPVRERQLWALAYGAAAIAGHARSIYLGWRGGGKGVATAAGMFMVLAPVALLVAAGAWAVVIFATGYSSLASMVGAVCLPLVLLVTRGTGVPALWVSVVVAVFVLWSHRANIGRLRRGEEQRFGRRHKRPKPRQPQG